MPTQEQPWDILIVDDDYAIREMLKELMEDAGYRVGSAENGAQALEQLRGRAEPPRVILLDLMMPVMTGWEFYREQQSDPQLAAIPVIVLSARPSMDQEGFAMDVAGFVPKPTNLESLLALVARYCS